MSSIIDDPQAWVKLSSKRTEVPSVCFGVLSPSRHAFNRKLCLYLRSIKFKNESDFISHFHDNWVLDSSTLDAEAPSPFFFRIPMHYTVSGVLPHHFLSHVFIWYKFLIQQHFRPYWDDIEGVGISVMRDFFPPLDLRRLEGYSVPLPMDVRADRSPRLIRDSRTADLYLGGPVSLVNHACSKHSNCVLNLKEGVFLAADTYIKSGTRIFICYNSNEAEMLESRGFICAVCAR